MSVNHKKAEKPDTKPENASAGTVFAGGNPNFEERSPVTPKDLSDTAVAGGNPNFDERRTSGKIKENHEK